VPAPRAPDSAAGPDADLRYASALDLAWRLRARSVSAVALVEQALARIEEVNPALNCFCFVYPEEALERARAADAALDAGGAVGPLHGLPVAVKDVTPTKGKRTTMGSRLYEQHVPDRDSVIVERLAGAGAILVGKTTTPEFAHSGFTESPLWGVTRNPWDPARTPGGSSGGSAAAVATGCVPLAEGTDMGGSVRIPAAYCGVVGLKPSLGRIPMDILPTVFDDLSHFGPLARTVDDAALFLNVTNGYLDRDFQSLPGRVQYPLPLDGDVEGRRLALSLDLGFYAVTPEVEAEVRAAADALAARGAIVEEVSLPWRREIADAWEAVWGVFLEACFEFDLERDRERLDPDVVALVEGGRRLSALDYKRVEILRTRCWHDLCDLFERHDALLCPTCARTAPPVEAKGTDWGETADGRLRAPDMTEVFNFLGRAPALSVPCGFAPDGLPVGVQIVGPRFADGAVLRIGKALETARPWSARRPPL